MTAIESTGSGNWATGGVWSGGVARAGDTNDVTIKNTHDVTMSQDERAKSIYIENGGTLTISGTRTLVIVGKDGSSYSLRTVSGSEISGTLNVKVEGDGGYISEQGTGGINNLEVDLDSSSEVHYLDADLSIADNLTITEGIFNTNASSNRALTVNGTTGGAGTLTLNNSTYTGGGSGSHLSMTGTVTIGTSGVITNVDQLGETSGGGMTLTCTGSPTLGCRRWRQLASKWTPATSTLKVEDGSYSFGNASSYAIPYNFEVDNSGNTNELDAGFTVTKNLTITAGTLDTTSSNHALTVTGHCSVGTAGTLTCNTSTCQFGSLQVTNSGSATMNFSSGTTTIDCSTAGDGTWATQFGSSATINFNNGIIKFAKTDSGTRYLNFSQTHPLNNVIVDTNYDIPFAGQFHTTGYLDIQDGTLKSYGGTSDMAISGDLTVGNGTDAARLQYTTDPNGFHNQSFGSVTVKANGTFDASNQTTTINGGFHNNGTYTHNGGIIEMGGTGSVVNALPPKLTINNDPVYGNFDGSTSSINAGSPTMFDDIFAGAATIMAWIYPKGDGEQGSGRILDKNKWLLVTKSESSGYVKLFFQHEFSSGGPPINSWSTTNAVIPVNAWTHVAVVYDGSSDSNDPVMYINGVSAGTVGSGLTQENSGGTGSPQSDASSDLYIGNSSNGSKTFDGYIADVKIYKAAGLSSTQIPIAAAKINQEPDLISPNPPKGWYKLTANTTTDSSGNSNTASASNMGSVVYDVFTSTLLPTMTEVDSLEVESGVLDLDNRNYVHLDGSADYITTGTALQTELRTSHSWSAWIKMDDGVNGNDAIVGARNAANEDTTLFYISSGGKLTYYYAADGDVKYAVEDSASFVDGANPWKHVVATMSYTDSSNAVMKVFVDGEEQALSSTASNNGAYSGNMGDYTSSDEVWIAAEDNNNTARWFFDGGLRDVRFYDYNLSAEQVKSLYLGRYLPTPLHWWKINEGTGETATIEDYGTGTDADGTGVSLTWVGTDNYKINGSARIGTNGSI